jgi:hypothetical protein
MKTFKVRGKNRLVGNVKIPTVEAMAAFHARGMFHDLQLPCPPVTVDYITAAKAALGTMLGNGEDPTLPPGQGPVGDCVIAEDLHLAAMRACNAGAPWAPTTTQALDEYSAVTGFVIGQPATDQGTDPLALVQYRLGGAPYPDGSTIIAAVAVDATKLESLQQAVWLADGVIGWASLPDGWESEEDGGDVWDVAGAPVPANGHGFGLASYGKNFLLTEWGIDDPPIELTPAAAAKYLVPSAGGGVVALLGSNVISNVTSKCPAGYDLSTLQSLLAQLGAPMGAALTTPAPATVLVP